MPLLFLSHVSMILDNIPNYYCLNELILFLMILIRLAMHSLTATRRPKLYGTFEVYCIVCSALHCRTTYNFGSKTASYNIIAITLCSLLVDNQTSSSGYSHQSTGPNEGLHRKWIIKICFWRPIQLVQNNV